MVWQKEQEWLPQSDSNELLSPSDENLLIPKLG